MVSYSNGYIPDSLLVTFATGWNNTDGYWAHKLSTGTYVKHMALVARAKARTGRTLQITEGWGAYRPYNIQVLARQMYGNGAAWPGTSSHGGFWEGQQTLAIDYGNWAWVYNGDRAAFYADCRAVGLAPGLIHPSRGNNYPDEPWHVVDLTPWAAPPPSGGGSSPSINIYQEERMYDLINVQGKANSHRAGTFAIMRSNPAGGSQLFAKRITTDVFVDDKWGADRKLPVLDNTALLRWQKTMKFHDLV